MPFKISARTILHLGSELISSDAIAFYELIKNAFDARSERVRIRVVVRLPYAAAVDAIASVRGVHDQTPEFNQLRTRVLGSLDARAPELSELKQAISTATTVGDLIELVEESSYIEFADTGEGMSLEDLNRAFLTIGTRGRLNERHEQRRALERDNVRPSRPVLGEKGVGRLSAMRLGRRLHVRTTAAGERAWNLLDIDWGWFSHDSEKLLEEIPVEPRRGPEKSDSRTSGTTIRIAALNSEWSLAKLEEIARKEFSKLTDPFATKSLYPISARFNGEVVPIRRLSDVIFDEAHATVEVKFELTNGPRLSTRIDYRRYGRTKTIAEDGTHLATVAGAGAPKILRSLGPFEMRLYWFNRRVLTAVEGIGDVRRVRELVAQWSGGLMIYRDGFRVYPYGGPDDDWLDLDRKALAAGGYKVNRAQIVGKVDISALTNPRLTDQTNREGLRDCPETAVIKSLLRHVLLQQFKPFLDLVDEAEKVKERLTFADIEERVEAQERRLQENIEALAVKYPILAQEPKIFQELKETSQGIRDVMEQASLLARSFEKGRLQLVQLAGLGLMMEIVAHELNRATSNTLTTLAEAKGGRRRLSVEELIPPLEAQLKTLQKRLRILDPLTTTGRQVKESFDVVEIVQVVVKGHEAQLQRHAVRAVVEVVPEEGQTLRVKMVKGMVVQILENLLSNSIYWLKQQRRYDSSFRPVLTITVDADGRRVLVQDNGPGVAPERREDIFDAFVTTKPPGEGKGLGLFISREIAMYHGTSLFLADRRFPHKNRLNTFVFSLVQR